MVSVLIGNGDGSFDPKVDYAVGSAPHSVVVGNFDSDGILDAAAANLSSSSVSVLKGQGNGTFAAKVDYPVGSGPHSIRLGDLDADGRLDLVTANQSSSNVSVLRGLANGTFAAAASYPSGSVPKGVAVADVSGDGRPDVMSANTAGSYPDCCQPGGNTISVLLGTGTGALGSAATFTVGQTPFAVTAGDLDGDGDRDLATANWHSNDVTILLNTTSGGGNQPPLPVIDTPASTLTWKVGDQISFTGHATDPEQGTLPASALTWELLLQHCPSNCHQHTLQSWPGVASGSFASPDHEYPSYLELKLTATDAGGQARAAPGASIRRRSSSASPPLRPACSSSSTTSPRRRPSRAA